MPTAEDCVIDYKKIFLGDERDFSTDEEIEELKKTGQIVSNYIEAIVKDKSRVYQYRSKKIMELVYTSSRFGNREDHKKAMIAANAMFTDEKFIQVISASNVFTFTMLCTYLKCLRNLQNGANDEKLISTVNNFSTVLVNHFDKIIGPVNINLIINKLNEMVTFKAEELSSVLSAELKKRTRR